MNSLLTPTTAFLNSCLDFEDHDTPNLQYGNDGGNVFDKAFEASNIASGHQHKTSTEYEGYEGMITPEGVDGLGLGLLMPAAQFHQLPETPPTSVTPEVFKTPSMVSASPATTPKPRKKYRKRKPISEKEKASKRVAFLERNRVAADKCRTKKKQQTSQLEEDVATAQTQNTNLKMEHLGLLQEVNELKDLVALCDAECETTKNGLMPSMET